MIAASVRGMFSRRAGAILFALATGWLAWHGLSAVLPVERWPAAVLASGTTDVPELLFAESLLPRLLLGFLAGAALGSAGSVFQHLFRNPLADPALLGVASGAQLALTLALLFAPGLWAHGQEPIAWTGAAAALCLTLGLGARRRFEPGALVLSGLVINLYFGALAGLLVLFNHDFLTDLLLWQAGSLNQSGWGDTAIVATRLVPFWLLLWLLRRSMRLLELGDAQAKGLGSSVAWVRGTILVATSLMVGSVIGSTGLIGFVGLAAPHLARAAGLSRRSYDPAAAALAGGMLLIFVDQIVREISTTVGEIPTGSVVAVLGGPLVLLLLRFVPARRPQRSPARGASLRQGARSPRFAWLLVTLAVVLVVATIAARTQHGWSFDPVGQWAAVVEWRALRIVAALAAGAALGISGFLLQQVSRNPLASPELLGISQGAGLGLVLAALIAPLAGPLGVLGCTAAGGLAALAFVGFVGKSLHGDPERTLLAGIAVGGIASGVTTFFLASGDPRVAALLSWFSGSMGRVDGSQTMLLCATGVVCLCVTLYLRREIDVLTLGTSVASAVGVSTRLVMAVTLATAAMATAAATIVIGPLSFVGLMAPHMVRVAGFRGVLRQAIATALLGGLLLLTADWVGRNIAYPWPISAGLLSSFIGGPYLLFMLLRRPTTNGGV